MEKKRYVAPETKEVHISFSSKVLVSSPPLGGSEGIGGWYWD